MINLELIGGTELAAKFDQMPARLHDELKAGIGVLALKLARDWVQAQKLRGQVLNYRTGTLFRSVGNPVVNDDGNVIAGVVSTPLKYGKAHEYGFSGTVTVRQHLREIKQAFGKAITPMTITVPEHTMKMNLPERSFLRSALREMEASGQIRDGIEAAVAKAIA